MRTPDQVRVFVGFDGDVEPIAYHVCCQSILTRSSLPVSFTPVALNTMRGLYAETHTDGSNAFIYSRFLVPWLCGWTGHAIFLDGDMLVRGDIADLWALRRHDVGVQVVKHDYETKFPTKYLGAKNENYPCKNWSSVVIWNCAFMPNRILTADYVARATGSHLHRFAWLKDEHIGELPKTWNWLAGEYDRNPAAKLMHYTIGTPCFRGHEHQDGGKEWYIELADMLKVGGQERSHMLRELHGPDCADY